MNSSRKRECSSKGTKMRYHIDTIPVWDAMKLDGECLMCALERKTELGEAERYLGASVMEPDVRVKVNDRGFCRKHHAMLFSMSNRLGHALMLESHMIEIRQKMDRINDKLEKSAKQLVNRSRKTWGGICTRSSTCISMTLISARNSGTPRGSACRTWDRCWRWRRRN